MVAEALNNAPEIKALDEGIAIQERVLRSANRGFWTPTVAVQGQMDNTLYKGGTGKDLPGGPADDVNWSIGANVTFPIYSGTEMFSRRKAHLEAMEQKRLEREAASQKIEQRVRSALHQAGAAYAGIKQANKAAEAAAKSLELVGDAYARGAVSVVELMDAQDAARIAEEAASDVLFDYVLKLQQVQRAVGEFDFSRTKEEQKAFEDKLASAIAGAEKG
jgi:outer membrane protein TolC